MAHISPPNARHLEKELYAKNHVYYVPNTVSHCLKKQRSLYEVLQVQNELAQLKSSKTYNRF